MSDTNTQHSFFVLMFTDIVGSMDKKSRLGSQVYRKAYRRHEEIISNAVKRETDAQILNHTGDGFLISFPNATRAIRAALVMQSEMRRTDWSALGSSESIQIRIGVHMGQVAILPSADDHGERVVGLPVDITARIMNMAAPGQILMSRFIFEDAEQNLREFPTLVEGDGPKIVWRNHGAYNIKGRTHAIDLFEVGVEGEAPFTAPGTPISTPPPPHEHLGSAPTGDEHETPHGSSDVTPVSPHTPAEVMNYGEREAVPTRVGPYKILRELGRGGMGIVCLGVRDEGEGFKKRVAIKVVKRGMDSEDILRRFELERQVLGALNHPNIARLHDAGMTADHRPYFVMEHVNGTPITKYCNTHNLSVTDRLTLFRKVCDAVAHAHQNLVVHRDLKPSNILVTPEGDVKLLDFGIAKLLNPDLFTNAVETAPEIRLLTPEYASPEQVQGLPLTTTSDVYSLGVLLYELLTGRRPYRFASRLQAEIIRIVCEIEPERPSTAVTHEAEIGDGPTDTGGTSRTITPVEIAKQRGGEPGRVSRNLRGDVDHIVMMALRKSPSRRYPSVEQLEEDIRKHLDGEPVSARPDSFAYRAGKFVKRNRGAVIAASLVAASLVAGIAGTSWQAIEAAAQRDRAEARFAEVRELALEFLLEYHDSIETLAGSTPAREMLVQRAVRTYEGLLREAGDDPELRREIATAYDRLGQIQAGLRGGRSGTVDDAIESLRIAERIRADLASSDASADTTLALAVTRLHLGDVYQKAGRVTDATEQYEQSRSLASSAGESDAQAIRIEASATRALALLAAREGDLETASDLIARAVTLRQRTKGRIDEPTWRRDMTVTLVSQGEIAKDRGRHAQALRHYEEALALRREALRESPEDGRARRDVMNALGWCVEVAIASLDADRALRDSDESLAIAEDLAELDPENTRARDDLALQLDRRGRILLEVRKQPADAAPYFRRAAELYDRLIQEDPDDARLALRRAETWYRCGQAVQQTGDADEAIRMFNEAVGMLRAIPPTPGSSAYLARSLTLLGAALSTDDRPEDAADAFAEATDVYLEIPNLTEYDRQYLAYASYHAPRLLLAIGEPDRAIRVLRALRDLQDVPDAATLLLLGQALWQSGERESAISRLEEALLAIDRKGAPSDDDLTLKGEIETTLAQFRTDL